MKKLAMLFVALFAICSLVACKSKPTVTSIEISGQDTEYNIGETFTTNGLKITAYYSDNSTADVTSKVSYSYNVNTKVAGTYKVVVTFEGCEASYDVNVVAQVVSFELLTENVKTEYQLGQELTTEGLVVVETYDDKSVKNTTDLSAYTVSAEGYDAENNEFVTVGEQKVTVSLGEVSVSYNVVVKPVTYDTVKDAIAAALANAGKVNAGSANINDNGLEKTVSFEFGEDYTHITDGNYDYYYALLADDTPFGIEVYHGEEEDYISKTWEMTSDKLQGVELTSLTNYAYEVYGFEALLDTLYYMATEDGGMNLVEVANPEAEGYAYSFSFEIVLSESYYYFVEVAFNLDDKDSALTEYSVVMNGYYAWNLEKDPETGAYVLPTDQEFDLVKESVGTQTTGEKTAVNPHDPAKYLYQSFDILDVYGNKVENGAEVTINSREYTIFQLDAVVPETANSSIDTFEFTKVDENGNTTWNVSTSIYDGELEVYASKVGKYTITINTTLVEFSFVINVDYAELESLEAAVYNDYYELEAFESATVYAGTEYEFYVLTNPGANAAATAALKEATENATVTETYEGFAFSATETGTYVVVLTSTVDENFKVEVEFVVEEAPSMADILNGKYVDSWGSMTIVFAPESEGALKGTLTLTESSYWGDDTVYTGTYTYYEALSYLEVQMDGCDYSFEVNNNFGIDVMSWGYTYASLTKVNESGETYTGLWSHPKTGTEFTMSLTLNGDNTGTYSFYNNLYVGEFTYVESEGVLYITVADNWSVTLIEAEFVGEVLNVNATIDGGVHTFEATK